MRVVLIDPSLFTWPYDSALALALQGEGHEVTIIGKPLSSAGAGPAHALLWPYFYRRLSPNSAHGLKKAPFLLRKGISHAFSMRKLARELRPWQPDVIHFQWAPLPMVDRMFLAELRELAPIVFTVHDSTPFNGNPRSFVQSAGALGILSRFDRLIVHTQQAVARLRSYGLAEDVVRCVPHGPLDTISPASPSELVDTVSLAPESERFDVPETSPARLADAQERPVQVLLFGRIKPYKGTDTLVQAAALMDPAIRARCRIRIVGEPFIDLSPLERAIHDADMANQVQIEPRFVAEQEVDTLLGLADILVFPYREIDASGVLMKSLAAGVPIVATRLGLFAEMLTDEKHGRLIAPDDPAALARALEQLVASTALRRRMGAEVRRLREQIPQWPAIAKTTAQIYGELLRAPARSSSLAQA